jgi:RNA polymerase sigma-70 factor (ECF subfamily)
MERDEILSRIRERIVAYAASRISREVAEDLAQEVLIILHEKYGDVTDLADHRP